MKYFGGKKSYPHELIGRMIIVVGSTNPEVVGLRGKIVDETKMTLLVESSGRRRRLLKTQIEVEVEDTKEKLSGKMLAKRPEERVKG